MLELHMLYQDSIQIEKNSAAVAREMILMDYDRRMYENKLKSEKEKLELQTNQFKRTFGIVSLGLIIITSLFSYYRRNEKKNRKRREELLEEVKKLKRNQGNELVFDSNKFELNRQRIETSINRSLNETDWTVLNIPLKNLVLSNKEIGEKAFLSADGIGSSLRRMYEYFEIKESKYKKISLLLKAIKISNKVSRS
jgi:ATP/maltotriose-dependent transcriptional regulator MalT